MQSDEDMSQQKFDVLKKQANNLFKLHYRAQAPREEQSCAMQVQPTTFKKNKKSDDNNDIEEEPSEQEHCRIKKTQIVSFVL